MLGVCCSNHSVLACSDHTVCIQLAKQDIIITKHLKIVEYRPIQDSLTKFTSRQPFLKTFLTTFLKRIFLGKSLK